MNEAPSTVRVWSEPTDRPLAMPWKRAIAMGRAYELLREDALTHLRFVQREIGFEHCRFHGLFHDDMAVVVRTPDGKVHYQWHQLDKVFDALRGMGLRPFVELGPMPAALASGTKTFFKWKMNITPPRSWQEWADLVGAFTRHMVDRYGLDEVRRWYFEVWNEPNLDGFWSGTQEEYWLLYEHAARAVKGVDGQLRVGGPATAQAAWIPEFIQHCRATGTPVDFISTHSYPQDEFVLYAGGLSPSAPGDYLRDVYERILDQVNAIAPGMEIHWTEWNPLSASAEGKVDWVHNASVDASAGGALVARHSVEADSLCTTMAYWVASDIFEELGMPHAPYSGTYGLLTIHGIPKPTFHAMALLKRLEGARLPVEHDDPFPPGCGLVATRPSEAVRVLLWNSPRPGDPQAAGWSGSISVPNLFGDATLIHTLVAPGCGSAYETWLDLGRPQNPSAVEEKLLRAHAGPKMGFQRVQTGEKTIHFSFEVGVGELLALEVVAAGQPGPRKGSQSADVAAWDTGMGTAAQKPVS